VLRLWVGGWQSGGVALLNHRLQAGTIGRGAIWGGGTPAVSRGGGAMGELVLGWGRDSGGVARAELNRRLQAFIPAG
jgi:hypothetical protein